MKSAVIAILLGVSSLFWTSCTNNARTNQNFMSPHEQRASPRGMGGPGHWDVNQSRRGTTIEFVN